MSNILEGVPAPRKEMVIFYLIDTSGSMDGDKIGQVNQAMEEVVPLLRDEISKFNDDVNIKIAILQFSSGCSWVTPEYGPISIEDARWNRMTAEGLTDFGVALKELNKKLSKNEFLRSTTGHFAPTIILVSDGEPTDDWEKPLEELKKNDWFKVATKIAFNIESNKDTLVEFVGNPEAVIDVQNINALKTMIKFVTVRSSQINSGRSTSTSGKDLNTPEDKAGAIATVVNNASYNVDGDIISIDDLETL